MFAGWTAKGGYRFEWAATVIELASAGTDNRVTIKRDNDGGLFFLKRVEVAGGGAVAVGTEGTLTEVAKGRDSTITFTTGGTG